MGPPAVLVPAKPQLSLSPLIAGAEPALRAPWERLAFFPSGCDALAAALASPRVPAGSAVALPALICRSVPERLTRLGLVPRFVDSSADSPVADAKALGDAGVESDVAALLLVDLFGFLPDEREALARRARAGGRVVVEDRCHSALTRPAEEVADAVIYSIRKSLPSSDGGALWLADEALREHSPAALAPADSVLFIAMRQVERLVYRLGWPNIYAASVTAARRLGAPREEGEASLAGVAPTAPSWLLSRQLHHAILLARTAERRRENHRRLAAALKGVGGGVVPLFVPPREGEVPQVLALHDPSGELVDYLRDRGVGANRWPGEELPGAVSEAAERFPHALRWNREMACLPIHQSIESRHIERMVTLIEQFTAAGK